MESQRKPLEKEKRKKAVSDLKLEKRRKDTLALAVRLMHENLVSINRVAIYNKAQFASIEKQVEWCNRILKNKSRCAQSTVNDAKNGLPGLLKRIQKFKIIDRDDARIIQEYLKCLTLIDENERKQILFEDNNMSDNELIERVAEVIEITRGRNKV